MNTTLLALLLATSAPADTYSGFRQGYGYDFNAQKYVKLERVEVVGVPVPANLFLNLSPSRGTYAPVTVAPEAYHSERARAAAAEARADALEKKVDRLLELHEQRPTEAGGHAPRKDLPPPVKRTLPRKLSPQLAYEESLTGQQLVRAAAQVMRVHCADCHGAEKGRGGVSLFDDQLTFRVKGTSAVAIWESVESDEMPKKREPLDAVEKRIIERWTKEATVAKSAVPRRKDE